MRPCDRLRSAPPDRRPLLRNWWRRLIARAQRSAPARPHMRCPQSSRERGLLATEPWDSDERETGPAELPPTYLKARAFGAPQPPQKRDSRPRRRALLATLA